MHHESVVCLLLKSFDFHLDTGVFMLAQRYVEFLLYAGLFRPKNVYLHIFYGNFSICVDSISRVDRWLR